MYKSNPSNSDIYYLPFDGDERLVTRWQIYRIKDDIIEGLNNGSIVDVYTNRIKEEKILVQCIEQLDIKTVHVIT